VRKRTSLRSTVMSSLFVCSFPSTVYMGFPTSQVPLRRTARMDGVLFSWVGSVRFPLLLRLFLLMYNWGIASHGWLRCLSSSNNFTCFIKPMACLRRTRTAFGYLLATPHVLLGPMTPITGAGSEQSGLESYNGRSPSLF
jgi:hypothetical protein